MIAFFSPDGTLVLHIGSVMAAQQSFLLLSSSKFWVCTVAALLWKLPQIYIIMQRNQRQLGQKQSFFDLRNFESNPDFLSLTHTVCIHVCMCVCMYARMHVWMHVHVCMCVNLYVYTCMCNVYMLVCICMWVCMYVRVCVCMYVYMYVNYVCMYVCIFACMYVCLSVFVITLITMLVMMCVSVYYTNIHASASRWLEL